jgi:fermentation-respiration switch protein FrsA (DUF1100 family)
MGAQLDAQPPLSDLEHVDRPRFHAAPTLNRASILAVGLDPKLGVSPWDGEEDVYPEGIYLWRTLAEAEDYAWGLGDPFDVWEILGAPELQQDPLIAESAYTTELIPCAQLRPVLHVPGDNEIWADIVIPPLDIPVAQDPDADEPALERD